MKKSKIFGGVALAALAGLSLTSCANKAEFDISVVYKSDQGPTYKQAQAYNTEDGRTYNNGDLLPMWEELEKKFDVDIHDVGNYSQNSTESSADLYMKNGYKGVNGETVELVMATLTQIQTMSSAGQLLAFDDYKEYLPNYWAYLESHPSVMDQIKQSDGKIYSSVYFDGADSIELYYMISGTYIKKILDDPIDDLDTTTGKIKAEAYQPFNTEASYDVLIANKDNTGAEVITVKLPDGKSSVAVQNEGDITAMTGKALVEQFRQYLDSTYMSLTYTDGSKIFEKRSDIFLSPQAIYNTDDFIALWRCIKANPKALCGKDNIDVFVPRNNDANRQRQVLALMQLFGQKGADAEKERLYFDVNGELKDARTQEYSYECINKIHTLYQEGLIVENYDNKTGSNWRDQKLSDGTGAVYYDYTQSTAGTIPADMIDKLQLEAILPPVVDWKIYEKDGQQFNNGDKVYIHFTESGRSVKSGAWGVPVNADEEYIETAFKIIDYFYTDEGADLCDFGPNTTYYRKAVTKYDAATGKRLDPDSNSDEDGVAILGNETYVVVSDQVNKEIADFNSGWFEYYTRYVGNSLGFGNIRSSGLEYQFVEPKYMRPSMTEISANIAGGSMFICDTQIHEGKSLFFQCVPTTFPLTDDEQQVVNSLAQGTINSAWRENSSEKSCAYTQLIKDGITDEKLQSFIAAFAATDQGFLDKYLAAYTRMMS